MVGCIAALTAIAFLLSVYSALFFKVFVVRTAFISRPRPVTGGTTATPRSATCGSAPGRETNARQSTYCNFETVEGKRLRFLVTGQYDDAVDYMIERVETAGASAREGEFDREIVITGKTEAGFVVFLRSHSLLRVVVTVMMLLAWNLPADSLAIPIIFELVTLAQILSLGLFYKVQIQKDGFYYRTNPFDGRYYRYSDILDCRLVESQRQYGSRYNRGRIRKTYYFYDLKFIDSSHQTHRLPYNKSLYEGEIDELVARIERAREDGE